DGLTMSVVNLEDLKMPVDYIIVEMKNNADDEASFGEYYKIEKYENDKWVDLQYNERIRIILEDDDIEMVFRSIYGRIVAEADRFIDHDTIILRTVQYGLANYPDFDKEGHWQRTLDHLHEKYAEGGYLKLSLPRLSDSQIP
ncbi:MAG: hypothetical protein NC095_09555, partial [Muribaculum sp.]|nr:hypothetical protein [Muribaculum sp.]